MKTKTIIKTILCFISIVLFSCKSEFEQNRDSIKQEVINFSKSLNNLDPNKIDQKQNVLDSLNLVLKKLISHKEYNEKDSLSQIQEQMNFIFKSQKDSSLNVKMCSQIFGLYEGEGDRLYYLNNWGYVRSGAIYTKIDIPKNGKNIIINIKNFENDPWETAPIGFRDIYFKSDSSIVGNVYNKTNQNHICKFKAMKNILELNCSEEWIVENKKTVNQ
jgi:hypothetical protein